MRTRTDMRGWPSSPAGVLTAPTDYRRDQGQRSTGAGGDQGRRRAALRPGAHAGGTSPSTRRRTWLASARARAELGIKSVARPTRSTSPDLATPRRESSSVRASGRCARTMERRVRDRGGRRRLPRRSRTSAQASTRARALACRRCARCSSTAPTRRGSCSRIRPEPASRLGRSIDELAAIVDALDRHARLGHLPRLLPPATSPASTSASRSSSTATLDGGRRADRPRPPPRVCT